MSELCPACPHLSRRDFLLLAAATVTGAGCAATGPAVISGVPLVVDAGPAADVPVSGISAAHRDRGFFLTRQGGRVVALSSSCTHRRCPLEPQPDSTFECPCHGSRFDAEGRVLHGPATLSLAHLPVRVDAGGHLLITVPT